jgi:hypothetical protein
LDLKLNFTTNLKHLEEKTNTTNTKAKQHKIQSKTQDRPELPTIQKYPAPKIASKPQPLLAPPKKTEPTPTTTAQSQPATELTTVFKYRSESETPTNNKTSAGI